MEVHACDRWTLILERLWGGGSRGKRANGLAAATLLLSLISVVLLRGGPAAKPQHVVAFANGPVLLEQSSALLQVRATMIVEKKKKWSARARERGAKERKRDARMGRVPYKTTSRYIPLEQSIYTHFEHTHLL